MAYLGHMTYFYWNHFSFGTLLTYLPFGDKRAVAEITTSDSGAVKLCVSDL